MVGGASFVQAGLSDETVERRFIEAHTHNTTRNSRGAYARALAEVAAQLHLLGSDAGGGDCGKTVLDISDGAALASLLLKEGVVAAGAGARPVVVSLEVS